MTSSRSIHVVGAGLAGSECAWQLAEAGLNVRLYEMRGSGTSTPAHKTDGLAELVCSNSLGNTGEETAPGQLKWEAGKLGSLILQAAETAQIPAGSALGVDREVFARFVTHALENHPRIEIHRQVISRLSEIPRPAVIATGPLTEISLANELLDHLGQKFLYFFDAIAPIIDTDSIDTSVAWKQSRWDRGGKDYFNCPLDRDQYYQFVSEIERARKIEPKEFEKDTPFFEGCMPIEEMVRRGPDTPRFGPMKPIGLRDPRTERTPYAVVQLRQENQAATAYNMVGFQTKMAYPEQKRIFRMIPGLEEAEFLKLGSIHRNLYINSPQMLTSELSSQKDGELFFAGQITGVEGYFESTCIGLLVAKFIAARQAGKSLPALPRETALGSLLAAITREVKDNFQPTNINFGLFPPLEKRYPKAEKKRQVVIRAKQYFNEWQQSLP